ncbi:hypothetical protein [Streptomyces sp. NPDC018347]|uniref:hypothetical protein n=1 Tax=Streptomyces sp. NPDC018347 TaxID=3157193 RepID=UPI0033FB52A2
MTDRRPLGTGPATTDASRTQDTDPPAPRAQLAAEHLPTDPAATGPKPRPAAEPRTLRTRPAAPGQ